MPSTSIQRRLITTVIISQLLLAIGLVGGSVYLNRRLLGRAFDNALQERAMSIAALVRYSEETTPRLIFEQDLLPPPLEHGHPDFYEVTTTTGLPIARSSEWPRNFPVARAGRFGYVEFEFDKLPYRGMRVQIPVFDREPDVHTNDVLIVSYAAPLDQLQHQVLVAGVVTAAGTAILLLLGVAFAIWGMRRGLRPLAELADSAARVSPANWELIPGRDALNTTELIPLAQAMTTMLGGLRRAFDQQRDFVANAAHELKTPIAILKSTLQLLLQRPRDAEQYRVGLEQALTDLDRLEKLVHFMLRLARAEQASAGNRELEVVDLAASCQSAVDTLAPLAHERTMHIEFRRDGPMPMRGDAEDLRLVWCNLLENAVRFSPPGGEVKMRVSRNGNQGRVEIEDSGPGISEGDRPRIFERFYRGDTSRARDTGGYGLGLAISKAIVEAYGGTLKAEAGCSRGTRMVIELPLTVSTAR